MTIYWAYENWRADGHRMTVHASHCPFCKDGQGVRGGTARANGAWRSLGECSSREEALGRAASLVPGVEPQLCNFVTELK